MHNNNAKRTKLAERKGFEPSKHFHAYTLSSSVNENAETHALTAFQTTTELPFTNNSQTFNTTFEDFKEAVLMTPNPVILLGGLRNLTNVSLRNNTTKVAELLAFHFPNAVFRIGNPNGTDYYFARGLQRFSVKNLQQVIPNIGFGVKRAELSLNTFFEPQLFSLSSISLDELHFLTALSKNANRLLRRLLDYNLQNRNIKNRSTISAQYLLSETLKIVGSKELGLAPTNFALLFVGENAPRHYGTGHTLKVCIEAEVHVITQSDFLTWV